MKLKNILTLNGLYSLSCAVIILLFTGLITDVFGLEVELPLIVVAVLLIPFGGTVLFSARKIEDLKRVALITSSLDLLWVAISIPVIVFNPFNFTLWGLVITSIIAIEVGIFAYFQLKQRSALS